MNRSQWAQCYAKFQGLEGGGKQGAFIYVLNENGQWKDRQISL